MRMSAKNPTASDRFGIVIAVLSILLAAVFLPSVSRAAPDNLPPRPTPMTPPPMPPRPTPPWPVPRPGRGEGGFVELHGQFSEETMWTTFHWQDLWTVVQWQDRSGNWHDVEGWQGTFDQYNDRVCRKMWWVSASDFDKGPFRWVIYRSRGDDLLEESESFYLPCFAGESVVVEVPLAP